MKFAAAINQAFARGPALALALGVAVLAGISSVFAAGTWTQLTHAAPGNITTMLLLPDGTVFAQADPGPGGSNWYRLTPDTHGSYVNGTWTSFKPDGYTRAGYSSCVLTNGKIFIAGAEYGSGSNSAELFDPVSNLWTEIVVPTNLLKPGVQSPIWGTGVTQCFGEPMSEVLSNGDVLVPPVAVEYPNETMLYNPVTNNFVAGPNLASASSQSEVCWVKLPDNSLITINPSATTSERYLPGSHKWVIDGNVPVKIYSTNGDCGAGVLLPNGKAFFIGGRSNTVFYTPSGTAAAGTWTAGPNIPNGQGVNDGPAAVMFNGKVLCDVGEEQSFAGPVEFYEYDYVANTFTQVNGPTGAQFNAAPYYNKFLDLPDGTVLFSFGNTVLYSYQPDGAPLPAGKPGISNITVNTDGSFHLTGTNLNGISEGAGYGDDAQMASNYPLVRLTNSAGHVYYARTYNWSSTGVMTSNLTVTTEFVVPTNLPTGNYQLKAVANGIASDAVAFTYPPRPMIIDAEVSGANLVLTANGALGGRSYRLITSALITAPGPYWTPVATNHTVSAGSFSITATNAVGPGTPAQFFMIEGL